MENLKDKIQDFEKRHKKYGKLYYRGEAIKNNGIRGVAFWYECDGFFKGILHFLLREIPLVFTALIFMNLIVPLIIYAVIHIALGITGYVMERIGEKNLLLLEKEVKCCHNSYAEEKFAEFGISRGTICFDNGVAVSSGYVEVDLGRDCGCLNIYQLNKKDEKTTFKEVKSNHVEDNSEFNSMIASVDFNNKYGVMIHTDTKLKCMSFLSPSVQVGMIRKADEISAFDSLKIRGSVLSADTGYKVAPISSVSIFSLYPLIGHYFDEVDTYCQSLSDISYKVLENVSQINFVRENF